MSSQSKTTKFNTKLLAAVIVIIIAVSIISVTAQYMLSPSTQQQPNAQLPDIMLTLKGANGQQRILTKQDILTLEPYTGKGGVKSNINKITGVGTYTGVPVTALADLVGGITSDETLTAKAQDNYTMTYSYGQVVNGQDITTYDSESAAQTNATQPLKVVLTYYRNGAALPSDEGPLRMGILGSEGLITQGSLWAKMVIQLTVNPAPSPIATPLPTPKPTTLPTATPPAFTPTTTPSPTPSPTPLTIPATQVTLVGADGTTKVLSANDLAAFTQTSDLGGKFKTQTGTIDYGTYSGVSITTLLSAVGGLSSSQVLCVTAADGYAKNFTYTQVTGSGLTMYDPATNITVNPTHPITMILAYYYNSTSTNLPAYTDGSYLMMAFVGPDGYSTTANLFVKYVVRLQVYNVS